MKRIIRIVALLSLTMTVACSGAFQAALEKGKPVPPGTVLVIGKITVDPMVEQGNIGVQAARGTHVGIIKMNYGDNAAQPIDRDAMAPFSATEQMDWSFTKTSFIPLLPGTRYARLGTLMLDSRRYTYGVSSGGSPAPGGVNITYLVLYGDVKIVVPQNAKAVYIGTIIYQHDLKTAKPNMIGYPSNKVIVKDEYDKAMADLAAMKIPGITQKDVVKRLAVVIRGK